MQAQDTHESFFQCHACGRQFPWLPMLGGRQIHCECGEMVDVPLEILPALPPPVVERFGFWDRLMGRHKKPTVIIPVEFSQSPLPPPALPRPRRPRGGGGLYPHHAAHVEAVRSGRVRRMAGIAVILLVLAAVATLVVVYANTFESLKSVVDIQPGDDASVEKLMKARGAEQVIPWLNSAAQHNVLGMTPEQAKNMALHLEMLGAVRVIALGQNVTGVLVVELPDDPKKRQGLFRWEALWQKDAGRPATRDLGQRYILLHLRDTDVHEPMVR